MKPPVRLYSELASWWPLLSAPADYAEEAGLYRDVLLEACEPRTVLELGSGGGNNAFHLKARFRMTLVDREAGMLEISKDLNPECEHRRGDMRDVRLGARFDAVFVHDAVMYMTTAGDLERAVRTAHEHCRPGGAALFVPDCFKETFSPSTGTGGHDDDGRSLRYLEWTQDPDPSDNTYTVDYAIMLRRAGRPLRVVEDHHVLGLFERQRWLLICRAAGFEPELRTLPYSGGVLEAVVCRRP